MDGTGLSATVGGGRYEFRSFPAGLDGDRADAATAGWLEATALSFHLPPPSPGHAARVAASYREYGRVLTGVYTRDSPRCAWDATRPVATYASFTRRMNVGHGRFVAAHLIADVTVRATHRRRGLMRKLISTDLRRAARDGIAIAALRAMEATIYPRFGFGVAILGRRIEVDTADGLALRSVPAGRVEVADRNVLLDVAPEVFDRCHAATSGSLQRQGFYPSKIAGIWAEDRPAGDPSVRAALHYSPDGRIDGYVSYRFVSREGRQGAIEVVDLAATCRQAYLGLWDYLGAIDLVPLVRYAQAPAADILPWAMTDRGRYRVVGEEDAIWLRILDPVAALGGRGYDTDGRVRLAVSDPLDIAAGVYDLDVRDGVASVAMVASGADPGGPVDVSMDISTLGSLYLGGVPARMLAEAGRIDAADTAALRRFDALMACRQAPYCTTQF